MTGLMSTTGVPSIASSGSTLSLRSAISRTTTGCRPSGFGRSGDRVAKTPARGTLVSPRGCVFKTSRRASCNQVMTISSSPTSIPSSPCRTDGVSSIQASGAPSLPWLGARSRSSSGDRTTPIGRSESELESRSLIAPMVDLPYGKGGERVKKRRIGIFLFDGAEELDWAGPWEVLAAWAKQWPDDGVEVFTVAQTDAPVTCAKGLRVLPDRTWATAGKLDVLVYPGGQGTRRELKDEFVLEWLRATQRDGTLMTSVCTGALVFAAAGFLRDR